MRAEFNIKLKDNNLIVSSNIKFKNAIAVNILIQNTTKEQSIINTYLANDSIDESEFNLSNDGFYTIYHVIIPTLEWLKQAITDVSEMIKYDNIYVTDKKQIYKYYYKTNKLIPIDSQEILEINCNSKTNIISEHKDLFLYYYLRNCLINFLDYDFQNLIKNCSDKKYSINGNCCNSRTLSNKEIKFRRDIILMFLNLIKYYVYCEKYYTAQELLEEFINCYGYCSDNIKINTCNCHG